MNENCEKYSDLIEQLIEGEEVDQQLAARTESHVLGCAECRREYELLRREKRVLARYLFVFEPPSNSWPNFQARLVEDENTTHGATVAPIRLPRRRKRPFVFGFSPALAAFAGLLLFFGTGFVLLRNAPTGTGGRRTAEIKPEASQRPSTSPGDADRASGTGTTQPVNGITVRAPKTDEPLSKYQSPKSGRESPFGKKSLAAEMVTINQKTVSHSVKSKLAGATTVPNDEARAARLHRQNLEIEIAEQIEKIELLLRSFRNAPATENAAAFDVKYEKQQARELIAINTALRRDAETFGISYAEELLSRAEPYLLEIANLENNPAPDKVLDIRERVSSQNIIANLQVYNSIAMIR